MSKIGRNDACPCGSGYKYKKCCLNNTKDNANQYIAIKPIALHYPLENKKYAIVTLGSSSLDAVGLSLEKAVLSRINNAYPNHITDAKSHVKSTLFRLIFIGYDQQIVDALIDQATEPFIIPWALYNWVPDLFEQMEQDRDEKNIKDKTIALEFSQQNDINLTSSEVELFNKLNSTYFSYYKVKGIDADGTILIVDMLLDIENRIVDKHLESRLNVGDIFYARIVFHQERYMVYGIWPMLIPEVYSELIDDFKKQCIKLNNNQPLCSNLFRTRFEFDSRDILSIIIMNMVEQNVSSRL